MPKIIVLTDTHVTSDGVARHGGGMTARLEAAVARIAEKHRDAAAVVLTGDLADDGTEASYRQLRSALSGLPPCPVFYCLGNHDARAAFLSVFPEAAVDGAGFVQWQTALGGYRLIGLDSLVEGIDGGTLGPQRLAFLTETLAATAEPVLLFLHHMPFSNGMRRCDASMLTDGDALYEALAPHRDRVRHIFMGHTHRTYSGAWRGLPFTVSAGTCLPSAFDMEAPAAIRIVTEPSFTVVLLDRETVVVHVEQLVAGATARPAAEAVDA